MRCGSSPSTSFILTSKPVKCFPYHQILALLEGASPPRLFPSLMSTACCVSQGELVLRATADVVRLSGEHREERSFIKRKCSAIEAVECKVDKWLITSRNGMIHHFLKLSSLKHRLWRSISVFYSRSSCLLQYMNL